MKFQMFQDDAKRFYFRLLDSNDNELLSSIGYADQEQCTDGIREAIQVLNSANNLSNTVEDGQNIVVLSGENGREIARSSAFPYAQAATEAIDSIVEQANATEAYDVSFTRRSAGSTTAAAFPFQQQSFQSLEDLYDFTRGSNSSQPGLELLEDADQQWYVFHVNDESGNPILFSRSFPTAGRRNARIVSVIKNSSIAARYERLEADGKHFFILKARNGQEIARSRQFESTGQVDIAIAYLQNRLPKYADQYIKPKKPRKKGNEYNFALRSAAGAAVGFDAFRDEADKQYYFLYNDENGNPILFSQGYRSAKSRDNGIRSLIKNGAIPARYEVKEENGRYYFIVRAGNRQEIARSKFFNNREEMTAIMAFLQGGIVAAAGAYGVELTTPGSEVTESFTLTVDRDGDGIAGEDAAAVGAAGLAGAAAAAASDADETREMESVAADATADGAETVEDPDITVEDVKADLTDMTVPEPEPAAAVLGRQRSVGSGTGSADSDAGKTSGPAAGHAGGEDAGGGFNWRGCLPWLLLLLLLILLLWLFTRGCDDKSADYGDRDGKPAPALVGEGHGDTGDDEGDMVDDQDGSHDDDAGEAHAGADSDGDEDHGAEPADEDPPAPQKLGPNALDLGFSSTSFAGKIADFLSNPASSLPGEFIMDRVNFSHNSAKLNQAAYSQIDELVQLMKAYPNMRVNFKGHLDNTESEAYDGPYGDGDITLSAIRARCLYKKLAERGIPKSRLAFEGFAANNQIASNATADGRRQNRRLEVEITRR